jgi:hypothetical protein
MVLFKSHFVDVRLQAQPLAFHLSHSNCSDENTPYNVFRYLNVDRGQSQFTAHQLDSRIRSSVKCIGFDVSLFDLTYSFTTPSYWKRGELEVQRSLIYGILSYERCDFQTPLTCLREMNHCSGFKFSLV